MMKQKVRSLAGGYVMAFLAPSAIASVLQVSWPSFEQSPASPFLLAVMFCAWYGGLWPGLLSMLVSLLLADYFFIAPYFALWPQRHSDLIYLGILATVGSFISVLSEFLHRARHRAEQNLEAIKHSEDQFRTMANSIPQLAWMAHADGFIFWYNQRWYDYTGKTSEQMAGWGWQSVYDHEQLPAVLDKWRRAIDTAQPFNMDFPLRGADGRFRMFLTRVQPLKDSQGRVAQWFGTNTDVEELKRAEESLRQSESRLSGIIGSAMDAIISVDQEQRIILFNTAAETIFGCSSEEAIGQTLNRFIPERFRSAHKGYIEEFGRTHVTRRSMGALGALYGLRADGEEFPIDASISQIDLSGRKLYTVILRDITERKLAEAALRQKEEQLYIADHRLAEIVYGMTEACFALDGQWCFTFVNDQGESLLRRRRYEMLGQAIWEVFPNLIGTPFEKHYRRTMAERVQVSFETFSPVAERWLDIRLFPSGDGLAAFLLDIHERKLAEEKILQLNTELEQRVIERTYQLEAANTELRRSQAELQSLFESLPGLYLVLTPDLKIVAASDAYLSATLTTREGILGRNLFDVFPDNPDDPETTGVSMLQASLDRVMHNRVSDTMAIQRYDIRRPDGFFEERYWSPINSPMFGADRQIKFIVHRVEEVTEFVKRKVQLADTPAQLHTRIEQMEAEVFQSSQKVQRANHQLAALNKELEAFSYSVSHDLRAPLRHINGFSQALLEDYADRLDEKGKSYLRELRGASQEMAQLIDDLLQLGRVTRSEMHRERVNLSETALEVIARLKRTTPRTDALIDVTENLFVQGDKRLLRILLDNLLGNAWKFTGKRQNAEITFGQLRDDPQTVYFVRDNGAGFDMAFADKLFGAFQRLHSNNEFEGTGIGLATVQRIVHRHGGKVWAEGIINQGATFYFSLPEFKEELR